MLLPLQRSDSMHNCPRLFHGCRTGFFRKMLRKREMWQNDRTGRTKKRECGLTNFCASFRGHNVSSRPAKRTSRAAMRRRAMLNSLRGVTLTSMSRPLRECRRASETWNGIQPVLRYVVRRRPMVWSQAQASSRLDRMDRSERPRRVRQRQHDRRERNRSHHDAA